MTLSLPVAGLRSAAAGVPARLRAGYGTRVLAGESGLTVILIVTVYVAFLMRLQHLLDAQGFPLNDGGMFYSMIQDLRHAHYALPDYTTYNGGDIPFAYSPLPFYLAAFITDVFRVSVLNVLRFLPLVVSTLTIPAFYLLAKQQLPTRAMAVLATALFAFTPRAFGWEISGGGLTRSLGFLFAILAIAHLYRLSRQPSPSRALLAALLVALTAASHMEMAWFVALSYAVILIGYARTPRPILYAAGVTLGVLALTAPWWALVLSRHGLAPFLAAGQTGSQSLVAPARLFFLNFTDEPFLPVLAALGMAGFFAALASKQYFLPAWLVLIFILDPRKAPTYATLPLALLAAQATMAVIVPRLQQLRATTQSRPDLPSRPSRLANALPALIVVYCAMAAMAAGVVQGSPLRSLPLPEVDAMRWLSTNTPPDSRFLVITGREPGPWIDDRSEWFPALSDRVSVATVQGTEWLPGDRGLDKSTQRYDALQACVDGDVGCLATWSADSGIDYTHVYIGKSTAANQKLGQHGQLLARDCCAALRASLAASPDYRLIYDGTDSQVYERLAKAASQPVPESGQTTY